MAYVSLTPHLEEFIRREVKSGRYSSPSEVIREAVRLLEEKKQLDHDTIEERARTVRAGAESQATARLTTAAAHAASILTSQPRSV